jgi:ribosomal peptide maturation radical SAM protein 1
VSRRGAGRIALVAMPFGPSSAPALGLSLLKPAFAGAGYAVALHYATLTFVRRLGRETYDAIANADPAHLLGDWIFAGALAPERAARASAYAESILSRYHPRISERVLEARAAAPAFVAGVARTVLEGEPGLVGFTSTFAQNTASLAAAKLIKELSPRTFVVLGGANCEGEMGAELLERFPFVDAVVSGEADAIALELASRVFSGRTVAGVPGVLTCENARAAPHRNAPVVTDLDGLPFPDYHDFYEQAAASGAAQDGVSPRLLVEASRGCWWGARHHCTFCGLNGATMTFRSKSPERFIAELRHLKAAYGVEAVEAVDNILDYKYYRTVLPELAENPLGLTLFFEIKANLRKDQVALLAAAGVRAVQPGIESLDSGVLHLMRKGVRAIQNVQLLKFCKEYGIRVAWNLLFGFPGEDRAAYERMTALIPLLSHLQPPEDAGAIRMDRFSPYFEEPERFGLTGVRPARAYEHVYDVPSESLARLAYYFEFEYADRRDVRAYTNDLREAVRTWRAVYDRSDLCAFDAGDELLLIDSRPVATEPFRLLAGLDRAVYLACDRLSGTDDVVRSVETLGVSASRDEVRSSCERFVRDGLMLEENGTFVGLAVSLAAGGVSSELRDRLDAAVAAL